MDFIPAWIGVSIGIVTIVVLLVICVVVMVKSTRG
jgi:hypothetical protein